MTGHSGLGPLGMGTAPLGNLFVEISDELAGTTVMQALLAGVRYFDVAPLYGRGLAERRLGRSLGSRRNDVMISTKVGAALRPTRFGERSGKSIYIGAPDLQHDFGYGEAAIVRSLEASAERIGRFPDIVLVHDLSPAIHGPAYEEHLEDFLSSGLPALRALKAEGRIAAIGAGLMDCDAAVDLVRHAKLDVLLLAGRYTLLDQSALDAVLPLCASLGVPVVAGAPFSSGILAAGSRDRAARYAYATASVRIRSRVAEIETCCERFGVRLATAALHFPLGHPAVDTVLPGLGSVEQVVAAAEALRTAIPLEFWTALREQGLLRADSPLPANARGYPA